MNSYMALIFDEKIMIFMNMILNLKVCFDYDDDDDNDMMMRAM